MTTTAERVALSDEERWIARFKLVERRSALAVRLLDGRLDALLDVVEQVDAISTKYGADYASRHEMSSVLREEVEESWDVVKANGTRERLRAELVDVACVALRALRQMDRGGL